MPRNPTNADATTTPATALGAEPILNIRGVKVGLGPLTREHLPIFTRWENDFSIGFFSGTPMRPRSLEAITAHLEEDLKGESRDRVGFIIYDLATLKPIGDVLLRDIWPVQSTAEMGITLGEKAYWGKGYGTEATSLILDFAFHALGLHNVMLRTADYNERAIRAYLRAGFKEFGRRRESWKIGGRAYDTVYMECLATEFSSPFPPVVPEGGPGR
jgi:diamine N-acetyltransferase